MRVLFLTHRLPYAPNRGDRIRAFHLVRTLARLCDVEVVSLVHDADEAAHVASVRTLAANVNVFRTARLSGYAKAALALPTGRPLTHCLLDAPGLHRAIHEIADRRPPDAVLAYCSGMARFAMESPLLHFPLVLDMVDVDSEKWGSLSTVAGWPKSWVYRREERTLGAFEAAAARHAVVTLVVNERERATLQRISPGADVRVVQNGVDAASLRPRTDGVKAPRVIFCGVMNYEPNVEGVLWFVRDVWPRVLKQLPQSTFVIVGANPVKRIVQLASKAQGIEVTGTVADVREHLWGAAVSVAPLLTARGLQNKVLEAIAAGLPVVATPTVSEGLPAEARAACVTAESSVSFADAVIDLLECSAVERRQRASRADLVPLDWDQQLSPVRDILAHAVKRGPRP